MPTEAKFPPNGGMSQSDRGEVGTLETLVADADVPRSADRKIVEVAVGILTVHVRGQDLYLMTTRPEGKVYAGYWEFPGGKLEVGETVEAALHRELKEEIGLTIRNCHLHCTQIVDYPHAMVRLNFCISTAWTGDLRMLEGQAFEWVSLPARVTPILPGALPVLEWLQADRGDRP